MYPQLHFWPVFGDGGKKFVAVCCHMSNSTVESYCFSGSFYALLPYQAGAYILQIFDHYVCSGPTLLLMAIFQSVVIGWLYGKRPSSFVPLPLVLIYTYYFLCITWSNRARVMLVCMLGAGRFSDNIADMIGYKPLSLFKYLWMYGTPLVCSVSV